MSDDAKLRQIARPPAEQLFAAELAALTAHDSAPKPPGWRLSPLAVRTFILGTREQPKALAQAGGLVVSRKFYGDDPLVDRCIVTLMGNRALILIGEPGTAKSMLSELLAAAICGTSLCTIQGTAGTTEDQIKYSWNYAQLLANGPSLAALVPAPLYTGLRDGTVVRFEELTRCPQEVQDVLVSVLSDQVMHVPELTGEDGIMFARKGFNLIATANIRDRGVNEMSSALKRRFNFETVNPIGSRELELELVMRQTTALLAEAEAPVTVESPVMDLLVTTFQELRQGRTAEGVVLERPSSVMSTAEAVAVGLAAGLDARYFGDGKLAGQHLVRQLLGTVLKDNPDDAAKLKQYFDVVAKARAATSPWWKEYYEARKWLKR